MGACNFGGAVLGCVAVGTVGTDAWTDEERFEYRKLVEDMELSDDYVGACLWDNESGFLGEVKEEVECFAEHLQDFIFWHYFEPFRDESPLAVSVDNGYHSGFEMRVKDVHDFYREQIKFLEAQAEDYAKYYAEEGIFTAEEWVAHVEKAIDFADYALVRFAYNKGLSFVSGGWVGGVSKINAENVREFARFEKYGSELARSWWTFCQKYDQEYNRVGFQLLSLKGEWAFSPTL